VRQAAELMREAGVGAEASAAARPSVDAKASPGA
jgi:hypothetical protein